MQEKETTDLTKRHFTRQQSIIVNAPYALSLAEIDIVLTLLTAIHKEDKDFKDYVFTIKDLEAKTNRQWNSRQLKDTVKSLMSKPLELPKEDGSKGWSVVAWFSFFEYSKNGLITCRFDKRLKPYFLDIQGRYILGDIRHLLPMKSSYSKRVYLLLKEYQRFGTRKFEVEELMGVLKVPKSLLNYADFKRKVLKRSETDINKFTDLKVNFTENKVGRKVQSITFHLKKNDEDLKTFVLMVKGQFINTDLLHTKEGKTVRCGEDGKLYFKENGETIESKERERYWSHMHEHRDRFFLS